MESLNKYVSSVIEKISWKTIESYYKFNNIEWKFFNKDGVEFKRHPTIEDLKSDFINAANLVITKNITSMDYGNWVLFWTNEELAKSIGLPSAQMEALFVLTGGLVNNTESKSSEEISLKDLNEKFELAIQEEDYILARQLKSQIEQITEKQNEQSKST